MNLEDLLPATSTVIAENITPLHTIALKAAGIID
jgi:hypothetical protein